MGSSSLVPQPGIEPGPPALGVWGLSRRTTGKSWGRCPEGVAAQLAACRGEVREGCCRSLSPLAPRARPPCASRGGGWLLLLLCCPRASTATGRTGCLCPDTSPLPGFSENSQIWGKFEPGSQALNPSSSPFWSRPALSRLPMGHCLISISALVPWVVLAKTSWVPGAVAETVGFRGHGTQDA